VDWLYTHQRSKRTCCPVMNHHITWWCTIKFLRNVGKHITRRHIQEDRSVNSDRR
jgi:hypothetical protein